MSDSPKMSVMHGWLSPWNKYNQKVAAHQWCVDLNMPPAWFPLAFTLYELVWSLRLLWWRRYNGRFYGLGVGLLGLHLRVVWGPYRCQFCNRPTTQGPVDGATYCARDACLDRLADRTRARTSA